MMVACVVLLAVTVAVPGGAAAATQQSDAYSGTHVSFETQSSAVVDYSVGGATMMQSMTVQSKSDAESSGSVSTGASLSSVTSLDGGALSVESTAQTSAAVSFEGGASMQAHDNDRGVMVVRSGGEDQYVTVNVTSGASARSEGPSRVVVTGEDDTKGTFIVVGDGEVTVNDDGGVSADLGQDGTLVFRSYPDGRDDADRQQEKLISDGTAAAEVYVMENAESGSEFATDVVSYSEDTTVEVTQQSEGTVKMTADRSASEGKVVLTTVSEKAISSTDDLSVTVSGEAAAKASSYSELRSAIGSDTSKFLVEQTSSATASADVLVAVNHFSKREITMSDGGSGSSDAGDGSDGGDGGDGGSNDTTASGGAPGFTTGAALVSLAAAALVAARFRG